MAVLMIETQINVPIERCFDLARDISLHCTTATWTKERAIAGVTEGLIGAGEWVTFEAVHFGIKQRFTAKITEFEAPSLFADEIVRGAFKSMKHIHEFIPAAQGTLMRDTLHWISPLGIIGIVADRLFLFRYRSKP